MNSNIKNEQSHIDDFERLNFDIGAIISGYRPTVRANADGFDINSNLRKFLPLLAIFPFFLPVMMALTAVIFLPGIFELQDKCRIIFVLVASVVLIVFLVRKSTAKHHLRYRFADGVLEIYCSYLFKRFKKRIPLQNVAFKVYCQKGGHKKLMLKHGTYIFSIYDTCNERRGEYIIAVFTKQKDIMAVYDAVKTFYPVHINADLLEAQKPANIDNSDVWELMSHKTVREPVFIISSAPATGVRVSETEGGYVIRSNILGWIQPVISFASVIFLGWLIIYSIIADTDEFNISTISGVVMVALASVLVLSLFISGVVTTYKKNKVEFDLVNKTVKITYCDGFSKRVITLNREQTIYRKYTVDRKHSQHSLKPGNIVLAISNPARDLDIVVIVANREDVTIAAEKILLKFYDNKCREPQECFEHLVLADGREIRFAKSRVKDDADLSKRGFKVVNKDVAAFTLPELYLPGSILGIVMGICIFLNPWVFESKGGIVSVMIVSAFGLFMIVTSYCSSWSLFRCRTLSFDKARNSVYFAPFAGKEYLRKEQCLVSQIAAVQVCEATSICKSGKRSINQTVFQLNAVMDRGKDNDREAIIISSNPDRIYKIGRYLSDFLNVPLVDSVS